MKSFETSGMFVQEMILVAFFSSDPGGDQAVVYSTFQKAESRGYGCQFSFAECHLWNSYGSAE